MDVPRRRAADRRHPGRGREQTRRPVARRRQRPGGVFFRWATSWQRNQWTHDEGATRIGATASCTNWPIAGSGLSLDLERDRMRFERTHARSHCVCAHRGRYDRDHVCMHTRARHTHMKTNPRPHTLTMTLQGRRAGTACWLWKPPTPQLSQARPRTASTSLTLRPLHEGAATARWRSSKTRQKRIQF